MSALALLNATIRPGIELILELIDFDHRVVGADLVVTGEGSLDDQSLAGKAPIGGPARRQDQVYRSSQSLVGCS